MKPKGLIIRLCWDHRSYTYHGWKRQNCYCL